MVPDWYEMNPQRTKPWGSTHAMLACKSKLNEPYIVINGDDFYGQEAFEEAAKFLKENVQRTLMQFLVTNLKMF